MAVHHFTYHAYRSWRPDHPRGYTKGEQILPSDRERAASYDRKAYQPPVRFDRFIQSVLVWGAYDICQRRGWRLHSAATDPTHLHVVVSWRGFIPWKDVRDRMKNVLSYLLGRATGQQGRRWFVRDASRRRVERRSHFDYLMDEYHPDHRGVKWREGMPAPVAPPGVE